MFDGELNKLEYLLLTFSLGITYYGRLDWTAMSSIIGNAITYQVYLAREKRKSVPRAANKKDNKVETINNTTTYKEFTENLGLTNEDFIKLGDFYLQLLSQYPHNIFERVYSKS